VKVLIDYHNFVRDFRGSLLLQYALEALGHQVWVRPHWDDDVFFATVKAVDVVVACQIAEASTAYIAKYTSENDVHLVINSSEHFANRDWFESFVTYDCTKLSDSVISLQVVANPEVKQFIDEHPGVQHKDKCRLLGFPRLDISLDPTLRNVETHGIERRYGLGRFKRRFLYLSSLLFEETFSDVPKDDMEKWAYHKTIENNHAVRRFHEPILEGLLARYLGPDDVLLIKKHPWDMSDYFERRFKHPNVRVLNHWEYIVPCLTCADAVIHSFSTSAIEAWILDKPTISLLPAADREKLTLNHMRDEVFADSLEEVVANLECYPRVGLSTSIQQLLGTYADGKSTIRLAKEIHALKPKRHKRPERRLFGYLMRRELKWWLEDSGIRKRERDVSGKNSKMRRLAEWEGLRRSVRMHYHRAFREYVRRNGPELLN
jgi:surface carbohydrate biosynthesis protein